MWALRRPRKISLGAAFRSGIGSGIAGHAGSTANAIALSLFALATVCSVESDRRAVETTAQVIMLPGISSEKIAMRQ